jgi:Putative MetA-pathway of phenol degradation
MSDNHSKIFNYLLAFCLTIFFNNSFAIDLQPGEIKAQIGSFYAAQISYLYVDKGDKYTHGVKTSDSSNINQNAMLLRLGHAFEINQTPAYIYAQSSFNHMENKDLPGSPNANSNGIGDTTIAFALWPYANREKDEYFGVAGYVLLPTGDYDRNRAINSGLNIYQGAIQAGYQKRLSSNVNWMIALDTVLSGDNNQYLGNYKLEKDPLYNFQTGLQYIFNPTYSMSLGYFYAVGAESTINGLDQGDISKIHRYQLTGQANYSFGRLTLQYGSEFANENGYIEDHRLVARYTLKF